MLRVGLTITLAAAMGLSGIAAKALPAYTTKEKKPCGFCHTKPTGGPLTAAGKYYAAKKTLVGFKEGAATPAAPSGPALTHVWKTDLPEDSLRVAVAALTADKKPRVVTLDKAGVLTVHKIDGTAIAKETTVELGPTAPRFVVGHFTKDKPALIAAPGVAFHLQGDAYTKVALPDLAEVTGTVRFKDGAEEIFYFAGAQPDVWMLDLSAQKPLVMGRELVPPTQAAGIYTYLVARFAPEGLALMGLPENAQKPGVVGALEVGDGKLYAFMPWREGNDWTVILSNVAAVSPLDGVEEVKPDWRSPKLAGEVLDIAVGPDPVAQKTYGLYVLMAAGEDKKQRVLQFFGPPLPAAEAM